MSDDNAMKVSIGKYFGQINEALAEKLGETLENPEAYLKALCIYVGTEMHTYKDILHTRQVLEYMNDGLSIALRAEQEKQKEENK